MGFGRRIAARGSPFGRKRETAPERELTGPLEVWVRGQDLNL